VQRRIVLRIPQRWTPIFIKPGTGAIQSRNATTATIKAITSIRAIGKSYHRQRTRRKRADPPDGSRASPSSVILLAMQRRTCLTLVLLCGTAAAQQSPAPVSVGIVVDTSGSMGGKLARSRQMAAEFLKISNPEDEFFFIEVNDRPALRSAFTTNTYQIQDQLAFIQAKGRSALWDGVNFALTEVRKGQHPRKALLVISDGGDNSSHLTEAELTQLVRQAGVKIYAFGVNDPAPSRGLGDLAKQSGGRYFAVENLNDIPTFAAAVTDEVRAAAPNIR
jgi:hypothetical protein